MAGHMGSERITVKNLEITQVDLENNLLYLKGAVPGSRGSLIEIVGEGEMATKTQNTENKTPETANTEEINAAEEIDKEKNNEENNKVIE